jgi:fructose/tagatose bisphosphate aldolase
MYKNLNELKLDVQEAFTFHDPGVTIYHPELIQNHIDRLVYTSVFSQDELLKTKCQRIIFYLATELGIYSASARALYRAFGDGAIKGFSIPAMNIRTLTYDACRTIFRVAESQNAAAFMFELSMTESDYTHQSPEEFMTVILAAAIKEQYTGPIFILGDHCQFDQSGFATDKAAELQRVKDWVERIIHAGFQNIDIDGSTLVDLSLPSFHAQQKQNAHVTALMTDFIRKHQPENVDIAIGGEIGHIGDTNNTVADFEAFMSQYLYQIARNSGLSKISVQTGTKHGGVINSDGAFQHMEVDFKLLKEIGDLARTKFHLGGPVQHGASTLPDNMFREFVKAGTLEVHLSTGFQNVIFDTMPADLREEMYRWDDTNALQDRQTDWTEFQFQYKTRKKALGPFKERLWCLPEDEKLPIVQALEKYVTIIFDQLHIADTRDLVKRYIPPIKK